MSQIGSSCEFDCRTEKRCTFYRKTAVSQTLLDMLHVSYGPLPDSSVTFERNYPEDVKGSMSSGLQTFHAGDNLSSVVPD